MNIYSYISLSAFFLCFFLGNFIYHKNSKSQLNVMIALLCFLVGFLAFAEFQYRQTTDFQTAYLWLKISGFWPLVPPLILHISLIFTGKTEILKKTYAYILLYVPALIIAFYAINTNLLLQGILKEYWGWTYVFPHDSVIFNVMSIWTFTCIFIAGTLCVLYYLNNKNIRRLQAKYLIIGLYFPLLISMVSDVVMPTMSIRIPETTMVMSTVGLSFISYGVWKYRFPALTAAVAADEIVSTMSNFLILLDHDLNIVNINKATTELFGYSKAEILGKPIQCIFADKNNRNVNDLFNNSSNSIINIETNIKTKDNIIIPVIISKSVIKSNNGEIIGIVCIGNNIVDIKNAEEKIKTSLEEKELLLRELHHRVKNNLQIISSLINLQSKGIKDQGDLEIFRESQSRVKSMAIIHEKLYQSSDLSNINFKDYIQSLVRYLVSYYSSEMIEIELDVDEDQILNMDTAVPCGLIINELVINSLKHGFKDKSGKISIKLTSNDDTPACYTLIVSDNGIGLPPEVDIKNPKKLGLQLVVSLTKQLDGKIDLETDGGTKFIIKFRELIYKQRLSNGLR